MLSTLLFDLDGTLANTDSVHFLSWQKNLKPYNLDIDSDFFNRYISGKHNPDIVQRILPQLSPEEGKQLIEQKELDYRNLIVNEIQPQPGLGEFLAWANSLNLQLGLVTNAPRLNVNLVIAALGLTDIFEVIVVGEDLPFTKPNPLPYQTALLKLGVTKEQAIAFEDSPAGVLSAVGAGIETVGVLSGHSATTLLEAGVKWVIQDFKDSQLKRLGYY